MRMRFLFLAALVLVFGFSDLALAQSAHPFATPEQRLSVPTSGWFAEFTGQMAAWQGPALFAWNDAIFSPADVQNIARIGQDTKLSRPGATGRFGLGFNSVFHFSGGC